MTESREPDRLDRALAGLEPRSASPGFTSRVLVAWDERRRRRRRPAAGAWALAAAALAATAVGIFLGSRPEPPLAALADERESLRREHGELVRELESLRELARETRPVLYLGTGDDLDLVLDLSPLVDPSRLEPPGSARPASFEDDPQRPEVL